MEVPRRILSSGTTCAQSRDRSLAASLPAMSTAFHHRGDMPDQTSSHVFQCSSRDKAWSISLARAVSVLDTSPLLNPHLVPELSISPSPSVQPGPFRRRSLPKAEPRLRGVCL